MYCWFQLKVLVQNNCCSTNGAFVECRLFRNIYKVILPDDIDVLDIKFKEKYLDVHMLPSPAELITSRLAEHCILHICPDFFFLDSSTHCL
jgi:hypothetical protein